MVARILEAVAGFVIFVISSMGLPGIVLLMGIGSACIPLPSEVIMPFSGYLVHKGIHTLWEVSLAGALGCVVGSIPAYYLGMYGGRPVIERWGKYVFLSRKELDLADRLFQRHGHWIVFGARLLPVIRTFIAFPAGVARMPMGKFVVYTLVGSYPWCLGLAWVGAKLGEQWATDPRLRAAFHRFDALIGGAIVLAAAWFVWHKLREARRGRAARAARA